MTANPSARSHETEIRVRYHETDAQGVVHHGTYINYFELGRTEMLRAAGYDYQRIEAEGWMLVVTEIHCRYLKPAHFGDLLRLRTETVEAKGVRIRHEYRVFKDDELLAEGDSTVACLNREGQISRLPDFLKLKRC